MNEPMMALRSVAYQLKSLISGNEKQTKKLEQQVIALQREVEELKAQNKKFDKTLDDHERRLRRSSSAVSRLTSRK